ncbi:PD-(D/E)XK nuclease family protein [Actinotalea sp. M2MS4P-6]|uniref:PD-(D/E)XK nuclease family protein n=1 Tax=Actinotalea sp. M2MS4P-6 TaxID=2983762 RepID=UPI0021E5126F|nr:PD-(D/E)XK nuclease family protein [Actinotalea sp. M2MS4P-6]MCV2393266.1 PD-(D/E)XK nuclease family protein [Actinotalea sp. M2MS4P-6]
MDDSGMRWQARGARDANSIYGNADEALAWNAHHDRLRSEWTALDRAVVERQKAQVRQWGANLAEMRHTQAALVTRGAWTSGARTLLAALRLQDSEVLLTRGLAWVLRSDGRHQLGNSALDAIAEHLGLEAPVAGADVRVVTEESRQETPSGETLPTTRADLVVYAPSWTLVVEAKVYAPEQPDQLDRLHTLWADEMAPTFVFLTRGSRRPMTANASAKRWQPLSWADVAGLLRAAVAGGPCQPGVLDFIETLEAYHHV